ncbi:OstA-like protein [uncultured Hymenobacter sp.]|uniref:OstA-like protein n=1 Tax=uncultured Hymenobacter sp. TaxID=170016 RepID=UPI0035CB2EAB
MSVAARVSSLLLWLLLPLTLLAQRPASRPPARPAKAPAAAPTPPPPPKGSRIELLFTKSLVGGTFNGVEIRKVIGEVRFKQEDTFLSCDSAYQYLERNEVEAFSNVRVVQNDTVTITGDRGFYNGDARTARMRGNVVMRDPRMTLTTNELDYDLNRQVASYNTGGHLTDPQNTLDSQEGFYSTASKVFVFRRAVRLVTIDAKGERTELTNDTLRFNTISKIAYFEGPTRIKSRQGDLYAEKGTYNTITKVSNFEKNAKLQTPNYLLGGDRLVYDEATFYGVANGHVTLISKKDNLVLRGDVGRYWRALGRTKLYGGRPVLRNISQKDTLYLAADTLLSVEPRGGRQGESVLYAYPKVQIFRGALQGRCDSLTYDRQDSIIYLNKDPVLWQQRNQLTADSMEIRSRKGQIDQMRLYANAFSVSQDTLLNYNQVKGRNMTAFFQDNKLRRIDVLGNAESLYYAIEGDSATTGVNKAVSATMRLRFAESKLQTISFLTNPDASFIPPHELKEPDKQLRGFRWRLAERPSRRTVLGQQFASDLRRAVRPKTKKKAAPKKTSPKAAPRRRALPTPLPKPKPAATPVAKTATTPGTGATPAAKR